MHRVSLLIPSFIRLQTLRHIDVSSAADAAAAGGGISYQPTQPFAHIAFNATDNNCLQCPVAKLIEYFSHRYARRLHSTDVFCVFVSVNCSNDKMRTSTAP